MFKKSKSMNNSVVEEKHQHYSDDTFSSSHDLSSDQSQPTEKKPFLDYQLDTVRHALQSVGHLRDAGRRAATAALAGTRALSHAGAAVTALAALQSDTDADPDLHPEPSPHPSVRARKSTSSLKSRRASSVLSPEHSVTSIGSRDPFLIKYNLGNLRRFADSVGSMASLGPRLGRATARLGRGVGVPLFPPDDPARDADTASRCSSLTATRSLTPPPAAQPGNPAHPGQSGPPPRGDAHHQSNNDIEEYEYQASTKNKTNPMPIGDLSDDKTYQQVPNEAGISKNSLESLMKLLDHEQYKDLRQKINSNNPLFHEESVKRHPSNSRTPDSEFISSSQGAPDKEQLSDGEIDTKGTPFYSNSSANYSVRANESLNRRRSSPLEQKTDFEPGEIMGLNNDKLNDKVVENNVQSRKDSSLKSFTVQINRKSKRNAKKVQEVNFTVDLKDPNNIKMISGDNKHFNFKIPNEKLNNDYALRAQTANKTARDLQKEKMMCLQNSSENMYRGAYVKESRAMYSRAPVKETYFLKDEISCNQCLDNCKEVMPKDCIGASDDYKHFAPCKEPVTCSKCLKQCKADTTPITYNNHAKSYTYPDFDCVIHAPTRHSPDILASPSQEPNRLSKPYMSAHQSAHPTLHHAPCERADSRPSLQSSSPVDPHTATQPCQTAACAGSRPRPPRPPGCQAVLEQGCQTREVAEAAAQTRAQCRDAATMPECGRHASPDCADSHDHHDHAASPAFSAVTLTAFPLPRAAFQTPCPAPCQAPSRAPCHAPCHAHCHRPAPYPAPAYSLSAQDNARECGLNHDSRSRRERKVKILKHSKVSCRRRRTISTQSEASVAESASNTFIKREKGHNLSAKDQKSELGPRHDSRGRNERKLRIFENPKDSYSRKLYASTHSEEISETEEASTSYGETSCSHGARGRRSAGEARSRVASRERSESRHASRSRGRSQSRVHYETPSVSNSSTQTSSEYDNEEVSFRNNNKTKKHCRKVNNIYLDSEPQRTAEMSDSCMDLSQNKTGSFVGDSPGDPCQDQDCSRPCHSSYRVKSPHGCVHQKMRQTEKLKRFNVRSPCRVKNPCEKKCYPVLPPIAEPAICQRPCKPVQEICGDVNRASCSKPSSKSRKSFNPPFLQTQGCSKYFRDWFSWPSDHVGLRDPTVYARRGCDGGDSRAAAAGYISSMTSCGEAPRSPSPGPAHLRSAIALSPRPATPATPATPASPRCGHAHVSVSAHLHPAVPAPACSVPVYSGSSIPLPTFSQSTCPQPACPELTSDACPPTLELSSDSDTSCAPRQGPPPALPPRLERLCRLEGGGVNLGQGAGADARLCCRWAAYIAGLKAAVARHERRVDRKARSVLQQRLTDETAQLKRLEKENRRLADNQRQREQVVKLCQEALNIPKPTCLYKDDTLEENVESKYSNEDPIANICNGKLAKKSSHIGDLDPKVICDGYSPGPFKRTYINITSIDENQCKNGSYKKPAAKMLKSNGRGGSVSPSQLKTPKSQERSIAASPQGLSPQLRTPKSRERSIPASLHSLSPLHSPHIAQPKRSIPVSPHKPSLSPTIRNSNERLDRISGQQLFYDTGSNDPDTNGFTSRAASQENIDFTETHYVEESEENLVVTETELLDNYSEEDIDQEENVSDNKTRRVQSGCGQKQVVVKKRPKALGKATALPKPCKKKLKRKT